MNVHEIEMAWKSAEFNEMLLRKLADGVKQFMADFEEGKINIEDLWNSYENMKRIYSEVTR
jgi:hypothetical protein